MIILNDPGPWQQYIKRPDNIGLPLSEVSRKYIIESNLYSNQLFEALQQSPVSPNSPVSSGGSLEPPVTQSQSSNYIEFVVDTTDYDNFDMEIDTDTATNAIITWGDGQVEKIVLNGSDNVYHTYAIYGTGVTYTVKISFDNPNSVTRLEFYGND